MSIAVKQRSYHFLGIIAIIYAALIVVIGLKQSVIDYRFEVAKPTSISTPLEMHTVTTLNAGHYNHASTMVSDGNKLFVAWYAGSRETAPDVSIYLAIAEINAHGDLTFSAPKALITRAQYQKILGKNIHTLGNPILWQQNGQLYLYFVSTSGGWATSSINFMYSDDNGKTWSDPTIILNSIVFNYSTLTRGNPLPLVNGNFAIPMYHELGQKYGQFLVFNPQGELIAEHDMPRNGFTLQPMVVPLNENDAIAFLRRTKNSVAKIFITHTQDGGASWAKESPIALDNPDSGLAAIATQQGILIAFNNSTLDRHNLSFALLQPPYENGEVIGTMQQAGEQFSYPYFIQYQGKLYMSYTHVKADNAGTDIIVTEIKGAAQ